MAKEKDLVLALEILTEGAGAAVPQVLRVESFMKASARTQKASRNWTGGPGIQGVGVGERITAGKQLSELVLKVYVAKKKPKSKVKNLVPSRVTIPEVGKLLTDVEEIGKVEVESFTSRVRPAMPGCGVGHPKVTVGSFGCLVRRKGESKGLYILSNSHVLANEGIAKIGDVTLQPGRADGGRRPTDAIANLAAFVPFKFTATGFPNLVDAAIARAKRPSLVTPVVRLLGVKPAGMSKIVRRGMQVQKVGRTTDYTVGVVKDVNYRVALRYRRPDKPGRRARAGLRDQILCTRYTAGGDSGSVVLDMEKKVVGLHFAGSPSTSIFNRIEHVFDLLDLELV